MKYRVWQYSRNKYIPKWRLILDGAGNISKRVDVIGGDVPERIEDIDYDDCSFELQAPFTDKNDYILHRNDIVQLSDGSYGIVIYEDIIDSDGYRQEATFGWGIKRDEEKQLHSWTSKEYDARNVGVDEGKQSWLTLVGNINENSNLLNHIEEC